MKVKISGVEGLEGEYEVLFHFYNARYTTLELRKIKQHTGLLLDDFVDHARRLDPDVFCSALWVTLTREGKDPEYVWTALDNSDLFDEEKFGEVAEPKKDEEAEPALPPAQTPSPTDDGNESDTSDDAEPTSPSSPAPLALLENPPRPTGFPRSATGAA